MTTLTLSLDDRLLQEASKLAEARKTTVDSLVRDLLADLVGRHGEWQVGRVLPLKPAQDLGPPSDSQGVSARRFHPAVQAITGLVPSDVQVREEYLQARLKHHR